MRYTYNKDEKLKSQKAIEQLFAEGKSVSAYPLRMVYLDNQTQLKVGVSVSKRNFKLAVHRNRVKRLLREGYRLNKNLLIDNKLDHYTLMILYISKEMPDFKIIDKKMKALLTKFNDQVSNIEKNEKDT
ncbi:ribonuclease P protein component [Mesoflavibacter sabulilitoris]|uniref:Ribonuclease P protein component n=1 Tax=Mesoflavibacter zeaxanthinifaciens subsp. sabulilitoris TaxID=1520893 RepID=A0A2T1N6X2_9FLAO|nr:ribonuclease P protein component [Mesoflavibacter zeaxanthinifaciens]MBB3123128.1 ribonuclease P protein component [Mesoflavibacter zeaxanthinifaciens subsp. sabulilitoris]PSG87230.1 ribonuclease P protein component [Mesoflavibacter zeaxanthinifaciens subsp. sabulilitoris]